MNKTQLFADEIWNDVKIGELSKAAFIHFVKFHFKVKMDIFQSWMPQFCNDLWKQIENGMTKAEYDEYVNMHLKANEDIMYMGEIFNLIESENSHFANSET